MNSENKKRQRTFFWLVHQMKDYSQCWKEDVENPDKFEFDEGIGYDASTSILSQSHINIGGKSFSIFKAMAPIHTKRMVDRHEKLAKTDYILLFLTTSPIKKYLMNVFGDVYPVVTDGPCKFCYSYSTSVDKCTNCKAIEDEEHEEEMNDWRRTNNTLFEQHKHSIPKLYQGMYCKIKDPMAQCYFLMNVLSGRHPFSER